MDPGGGKSEIPNLNRVFQQAGLYSQVGIRSRKAEARDIDTSLLRQGGALGDRSIPRRLALELLVHVGRVQRPFQHLWLEGRGDLQTHQLVPVDALEERVALHVLGVIDWGGGGKKRQK